MITTNVGFWAKEILPPAWVTAVNLGSFNEEQPIDLGLNAIDPNGLPVNYTLVDGSLPAGLTLLPNGSLQGDVSPVTAPTNYKFTIRSTNSNGLSHDRTFSISVLNVNKLPVWTTPVGSLGSFIVNSTLSYALQGNDPDGNTVTFSLVSGSLPTGVTLSSSGLLSGNLTTVGEYSFTIRLTDAEGGYTDRLFSTTVKVPDTTPDAFVFADKLSVASNITIMSDPVTITGIDPNTNISVSGLAEFSINGGSWVKTGTVQSGDSVQLRVTSSKYPSVSVMSTITIGTVTSSWNVQTKNAIPASFDTNYYSTNFMTETATSINVPVRTTSLSDQTYNKGGNTRATYYIDGNGSDPNTYYAEFTLSVVTFTSGYGYRFLAGMANESLVNLLNFNPNSSNTYPAGGFLGVTFHYTSTYVGSDTNRIFRFRTGATETGTFIGFGVPIGPMPPNNSTFSMIYNAKTRQLGYWYNGVSLGWVHTLPSITGAYTPAFNVTSGGACSSSCTFNQATVSANFGQSPWKYTPPVGAVAMGYP